MRRHTVAGETIPAPIASLRAVLLIVRSKIISELLGHSSISITLEIYSHAIPSLQKESAARVAALILGDADNRSL